MSNTTDPCGENQLRILRKKQHSSNAARSRFMLRQMAPICALLMKRMRRRTRCAEWAESAMERYFNYSLTRLLPRRGRGQISSLFLSPSRRRPCVALFAHLSSFNTIARAQEEGEKEKVPATEVGRWGEWRGLVTTEQIEVGSGRMGQGAMRWCPGVCWTFEWIPPKLHNIAAF